MDGRNSRQSIPKIQSYTKTHIILSPTTAVNRTNNPLERFNRKMNHDIPIHPSMSVFVEGIKRISNEYVDVMNATRMQKGRKQVHAPVNLPSIPADFASFRTLD